jgi:hypothetical protein
MSIANGTTRKILSVLALAILIILGGQPAGAVAPAVAPESDAWSLSPWYESCRYDTKVLPELSGLAPSRRFAKVLWAINDSGNVPALYALDYRTCEILATVNLAHGMADPEGLATGLNARGEPTVWVGDIGDNTWWRNRVKVWEFAEPDLRDQTISGTMHAIYYPEGARDAESLMVDPTGKWIYIVEKAAAGAVYRAPADQASVTATRLGGNYRYATDAAMTSDGTRYMIRGYNYLDPHSGAPLGVDWARVGVPAQAQAEALCFSRMNVYAFTASEGDPRLFRASVRSL